MLYIGRQASLPSCATPTDKVKVLARQQWFGTIRLIIPVQAIHNVFHDLQLREASNISTICLPYISVSIVVPANKIPTKTGKSEVFSRGHPYRTYDLRAWKEISDILGMDESKASRQYHLHVVNASYFWDR